MLLVQADAGPGLQRAFAEHELQVRHRLEERVPDRLTAAVVRPRLGDGDLGVVLDDVAAGCGLLHRNSVQRGSGDHADEGAGEFFHGS